MSSGIPAQCSASPLVYSPGMPDTRQIPCVCLGASLRQIQLAIDAGDMVQCFYPLGKIIFFDVGLNY